MYVVTNALRNLTRNRGRNSLLFATLLLVIVSACAVLVIRNTSGSIVDDYKSRFGAQVTITPDLQKLAASQGQGQKFVYPTLTSAQQSAIAKSSHLKSYQASTTDMGKGADGIKGVDEGAPQPGGVKSFSSGPPGPQPTMQVVGTTNLKSDAAFAAGTRQVTSGRAPAAANEALVSREFADRNHLKIGDTFAVNSLFWASANPKAPLATYHLKVVGIYTDSASAYPQNFPFKDPMLNNRNEIYTTFDTVVNLFRASGHADGLPQLTMQYVLHSPADLEGFKKDVAATGVDISKFLFNSDLDSYNAVVKPVESMKGIATTFVIVVLVVGAVLLMLLSALAIRERKYEIGVLRAMGMKKSKVAGGLLTEGAALALAALLIGMPLGLTVAKPLANSLLTSQNHSYAASTPASNDGMTTIGGVTTGSVTVGGPTGAASSTPTVDPKALKKVDVSLSGSTILQLALIALLLVGVATGLSLLYIARFEPITILTNRN